MHSVPKSFWRKLYMIHIILLELFSILCVCPRAHVCVCVCSHELTPPHCALRAFITVGVWGGGSVYSSCFSSSPSHQLPWQVTLLKAFLHKDEQQLSCHQVNFMLVPRLWTEGASREESDKWKGSACINDEIPLADGSDLRSVLQICGWLSFARVHIHAFPLSCVCPWHSITPFFPLLFSHPDSCPCSILLLARSLHLSFIHRKILVGVQAFRPKTHIRIFVLTSSGKLLFRAGRTPACSRRWSCKCPSGTTQMGVENEGVPGPFLSVRCASP